MRIWGRRGEVRDSWNFMIFGEVKEVKVSRNFENEEERERLDDSWDF